MLGSIPFIRVKSEIQNVGKITEDTLVGSTQVALKIKKWVLICEDYLDEQNVSVSCQYQYICGGIVGRSFSSRFANKNMSWLHHSIVCVSWNINRLTGRNTGTRVLLNILMIMLTVAVLV